ncbi:nuclease-related domain-containing protein [Lyngbya sp. CCY1209]|uniref:nuclease-related domain-containing protein n=1 Tax=Lyngbya sp. CCY1209 TaxID=2886103 RepID=UPI002D20E224|nr:nuclease-related domain-containing protein [Lyngbya sp. CCY1209]MEB3881998.1 NERD domain-containing protein [Lyngbya sp. CCY1209]
MRVLQQSSALKTTFNRGIDRKVSTQRQEVSDALGGGLFGAIGSGVFQFKQIRNQVKGNLGEGLVSLLLMTFPNDWVLFKNAFIPTTTRRLTEIDLLVVGNRGIFAIEVKTWKGSFSAYRDNWKRREGSQWVPVQNSPTSQSLYHRDMLRRWLDPQIPGLPPDCIVAPVVFPIAKWVGAKDCSVPVLTGIQDLVSMMMRSPECLTEDRVLKITNLIQNYEHLPDSKPSPKPKPKLKKKSL